MNAERIFAYGSNMNLQDLGNWLRGRKTPAEAEALVGRLKASAKLAILDNHALVWNYHSPSRGGGAANIEERQGCHVCGVAFQVDQEWRDLFDCKEGHPSYYTRVLRDVSLLHDTSTVPAWVYYANPCKVSRRPEWPTVEYKSVVLAGARCWNLPESYIQELEAVATRD